MDLDIRAWIVQKTIEEIPNESLKQKVKYYHSWDEDKKIQVDTLELPEDVLKAMSRIAKKYYEDNVPDKNDKKTHNKYYPYVWLSRKIDKVILIKNSKVTTEHIKKIDEIPASIHAFYSDKPQKLVFKKNNDGHVLPWLITEVKYNPGRGYEASYTSITVVAFIRGKIETQKRSWRHANSNVEGLLKRHGFIVQDETLIAEYEDQYSNYVAIKDNLGSQMLASDRAFYEEKRGSSYYNWIDTKTVPMTIDGIQTKVVIDDTSDEQEQDKSSEAAKQNGTSNYWKGQDIIPLSPFQELFESLELEQNSYILPVHPYLYVFDLNKHRFVNIHVNNLSEYEWNHGLGEKLILERSTKELVNILIQSTKEKTEDLISGKMSGTIILATGKPGIGKTLTAEIFSEVIERPLYVVQCSQLGIDVDTIEANLNMVLSRAGRWAAILLVDEADVYIRDRGSDIVHNAIVGVFLRLIEYYNGVLFMTSNRGDVIDDAIISRATAWIKYELPTRDLLTEIWKVLSEQYKIQLDDKIIDHLIDELGIISGRTVRNLLKLVKTLNHEEQDPQSNYKRLIEASKYQKLD